MKDARAVLRDLRTVYDMKFRWERLNEEGDSVYGCTLGMLSTVKKTAEEAAETIEYLLADRQALLDQLTEGNT